MYVHKIIGLRSWYADGKQFVKTEYYMDEEKVEKRDWSMYTKVQRVEQMPVIETPVMEESSLMQAYDMEIHGIYNMEDRKYKTPIAVWNKVYQEYWYADSSSDMRQINDNYNKAFDIDKCNAGMREDGDWATANRLARADEMLLDLGISQDRINKAIKMTNDCFLADARYRDFRDDLSDYLMEDIVRGTDSWAKMEEANAKLSDLRSVLETQIKSFDALDEAIIKYAHIARERAWKHVKDNMKAKKTNQPDWELYNSKKAEYSQALMPKVSKKVGYHDKMTYMQLMSYVGTRYWQVVLGRTEEQLMTKARWTCFNAVSELLGAVFSDFFNGHNQEINHVDNWTSDFDHMYAEGLRDMDQQQAEQLIIINDLYREMDTMEHMDELELKRMLINR